ncbi:cyclin-like protein [Mycena belliarum]|uniref:Cyclin-like protein n=1 Tax=Mycena belliarum TaxID=1033014 RepID=A0AAD6U1U0_9AGAR|nr:cyclin-like protein [Mycena belliae]
MASKIPIRRGRTAGAENENIATVRSSQAAARAKAPGRAGVLAGSSKAATGSAAVAVASIKAEREKEALASAKRKREALRELTDLRNCRPKGKDKEHRKILGIPKKSTAVAREPLRALPVAAECRPPVFVPPPAARRLSSRPSLIPVLQREKEDEEGPASKRQRTSSAGPDEAEVEVALDAYDSEPEADPDGDLWEDLDAVDADDPLMVSEYVCDIQLYLREVELATMPPPDYMERQPKLSWELRALLNEWLLQVHTRYRLLPETLFLCSNLTDRFLATRAIPPSKLQLVGTTCLFIASKFEETVAPAVANFSEITEGAVTAPDILTAEQHILASLDWDLRCPGPLGFLRRISKVDGYETQTRAVAKYLLEFVLLEHRLLRAPPSLHAAAAMWLARLALGEDSWTPTLAHYAGYAESALIPVANLMLRFVLAPMRFESFYKKYAGRRNLKVSVYMRQWALARWAEGARPDLAEELRDVKNEIRAQKRLREIRKARAVPAAVALVDLDSDEEGGIEQ